MRARRTGLTMMELMVVLAILVALAAIVVPLIGDQTNSGRDTVTRTNLIEVRDAFVRYRVDNPFRADGTPLTPDLIRVGDLFLQNSNAKNWDPTAKIGWHGPYLSAGGATYSYPISGSDAYGFAATFGTGAATDLCICDAFSHSDGHRCPIVLVHTTVSGQLYVWAQSAGSNGMLEVPAGVPSPGASGLGSDFHNGATVSHVDDLTLRVYP